MHPAPQTLSAASTAAAASLPAAAPAQRSLRQGDDYLVCADDRAAFHAHGYVTLEQVLHEHEVAAIEATYDQFTAGLVNGMGRDLCDMSGSYDDSFAGFALVNAMLPRRYRPDLIGNPFERLSASISRQLLGEDMALDYDQFLSKKPNRARAAFAMHQDMGYWPASTPDTRTATCSLAVSDSLLANGCIRFIPGSHKPGRLLPHRPSGDAGNHDRSQSHTLELDLPASAVVVDQEVRRGSITVHDEWVVHGSLGNRSAQWRKTYVIAYRSAATVAHERAIGFTHSHNDTVNWQTALALSLEGQAR
jgi:ectoine hydroxylase-related dioxygenase (phytanoyl-CoA dioxygenase family)